MIRKAIQFSVTAVALSFLVSGVALAQGSTTGNLSVTSTVVDNCEISSTSAVAFGNYDPAVANASSNKDGTGTITLTCTQGAVAVIALDDGANADVGQRRMTDGTDHLQYNLYQDSARTTVWGDGADAKTADPAPSTDPVAHTVYGRVPGGQDVPAGSYTDTVGITVNF